MASKPAKKYFTVEEYYRMSETGILKESDRVELIHGEVFEMSPIGSQHAACVKRLAEILHDSLGKSVIIGIQDPIRLSKYSEPQPDISILKRKKDYYASAHPTPGDVPIIIEVADTSVEFDRNIC